MKVRADGKLTLSSLLPCGARVHLHLTLIVQYGLFIAPLVGKQGNVMIRATLPSFFQNGLSESDRSSVEDSPRHKVKCAQSHRRLHRNFFSSFVFGGEAPISWNGGWQLLSPFGNNSPHRPAGFFSFLLPLSPPCSQQYVCSAETATAERGIHFIRCFAGSVIYRQFCQFCHFSQIGIVNGKSNKGNS